VATGEANDDMPQGPWLGETLALIQHHYAKGLLSKVKLSRRILAQALIETSPWELIAATSCPEIIHDAWEQEKVEVYD